MKARVIAYYLPQFYPIPENDAAWGPGFTEWINVAKAKPQFRGHYQPRIPADLGFYDLRLPEVREQQAQMAMDAGVEGFCYWHYWFGNRKMLLQRVFEEVLSSGKPDFPFCLAWANHDWTTKTWNNDGRKMMIAEQTYPGEQDYIDHFNYVLPAFKDHRYITIDEMPIFPIFDPYAFQDVSNFMQKWQELAKQNGLKGIHFIAIINSTTTMQRKKNGTIERVFPNLNSSKKVYEDILKLGFQGINSIGKSRAEMITKGKYLRILSMIAHKRLPFLPSLRYNYPKVVKNFFAPEDAWENVYPTIMPQWDRTPRASNSEGIYINATPENFKNHIKDALETVSCKEEQHKILFLRSWNEWGEGNYVEPDSKYGHEFLNALKETIL